MASVIHVYISTVLKYVCNQQRKGDVLVQVGQNYGGGNQFNLYIKRLLMKIFKSFIL